MWRFDPTANLNDFDRVPGMRDAWNHNMTELYAAMLYSDDPRFHSALLELSKWGKSASDIRFFSPAEREIPAGSIPANVSWSALPTSYDDLFSKRDDLFAFLDAQQPDQGNISRMQDEYCEWTVVRDTANKIIRVIFTSEPPEYYGLLFAPPAGVDPNASQNLLIALYEHALGITGISIKDLMNAQGEYDPYNKYNAQGCIHMQQINNTLGAEVNIAARSSILRARGGKPITDAQGLIKCARYGDEKRQSDPNIGATVNSKASENRFVTLENPVGLYMTGLDTTGWSAPDKADPKTFWTVLRGTDTGNEDRNMIVRAEFSVPNARGYTVSDIAIGGVPIRFGAEIAAHIGMRLGATVGPVSSLAPPRSIGCANDVPVKSLIASLTTHQFAVRREHVR
jgi:hypothetical protein